MVTIYCIAATVIITHVLEFHFGIIPSYVISFSFCIALVLALLFVPLIV